MTNTSPFLRKTTPLRSYFFAQSGSSSFFMLVVLYHKYNTMTRQLPKTPQNHIFRSEDL
jgi:hypothetical protein